MGAALRQYFATSGSLPNDGYIWQALDEVRDRIAFAAEQRGLTPRDFAATLVMVISAGDYTIAAQVGDGAAVVRQTGEWTAISWPEQGEYASTTYFVTDDAGPRLRIVRSQCAIDAIAVFTDGIERLALDYTKGEAHQPFFNGMIKPLERLTKIGSDRDLAAQLATYLESPAVCDRTDDDKTLLLAIRR